MRSKMGVDNLKLITESFTKEIKQAKAGLENSLLFTRNRIGQSQIIKDDEAFQVIKIGGSILQNAMVSNKNKHIVIDSFEEERLPVFTTKKAFLAFIKSHLRKNTRFLSLNFAYPIKPIFKNGFLDGVLLTGTKEHTFSGLVGERIGMSIENFIKEKFNRLVKVTLANDTVCLLLSGLMDTPPLDLASGVVGTGLNFAFFLDDKQLVNLESHNFDKFVLSPEAKIIDSVSKNPGKSLFEKEVAGNWLFKHYNLRKSNRYKKIESTHELDKIARGHKNGDKQLARKLFKRAAQLVACQVAGITLFKKRNMLFVVEGSLFWIGYNFRQTVVKTVSQLIDGYRVSFRQIKNCGIIGAAKLLA